MRVTWYGHACFRLEGSGVSIVTDPYTPEAAGLLGVSAPADAVVMSSALDVAHSNAAMIAGAPFVLNALDALDGPVAIADGVLVEAVAAMEGVERPDDPKANALYRLELDGVSVCHMGDVGRRLTEEQLAPLRGRVDVLLALAGAGLTIALADLDGRDHRDRSTRRDPNALQDAVAALRRGPGRAVPRPPGGRSGRAARRLDDGDRAGHAPQRADRARPAAELRPAAERRGVTRS